MKRGRKRGYAEPVRCYNFHMNLRLTYFEAGVLHKLVSEPGYEATHYEAAAVKRLRDRIALAASQDGEAVLRRNTEKRLKKLKDRVEAQEKSGMKPDWWDLSMIRRLEELLSDEPFVP